MDSLKVFISSTWLDLEPERAAVERALQRLRSTRFVGMEYFGARDSSTRDVSLAEVDRSDVYVGVFGHRYGSGITEQEYRRARGRSLPCLVYLKDGWTDPLEPSEPDALRLQTLRRELGEKHTVGVFGNADELAAKVVADLHNLVFDRLIVQGIAQLRADYDARIQRFLAEYLGSPEHPIAFGGRDRELRTLDAWLADHQGPPYALLAGPAGRGKSALLVRWAQLLMQQPDVAVIFLPISIRFRTNLASVAFASIAARLAALHGEAVPGATDTPPEVWRALMSSYLRRAVPQGRQFVLIVDGADESGDWAPDPDLFPAAPPAGLRVLVSARYLAGDVDAHGWLERLGWTNPRLAAPFDLRPLTPQGLVSVLRNMSVPLEALSARADVVAELFRLSQGDPLLVNLYVADLWTRGEAVARLQPEDLASLEPGLDGYFRRWWDDQRVLWGAQSPLREPAVNAVLDTLACALGPLRSAELLELLPPTTGVAFWALEEALRSLQRFVIGDGESQGYAFSHPRLGDHFHHRLSKGGQAQLQEARYVAWGMTCLDELATGRRDASQVPTYVLQFLRPHMERAGSDARAFMAFAGPAWISAWERLDKGSYTGFLSDLGRVREIAATEDERSAREGTAASFMADELRCALYASSIASIAADVPLEALVQLMTKEIWSPAQAIAYGTRIADPGRRMRTLLELLAMSDDAHRPLSLAAAASEARELDADREGGLLLSDVIRGLAEGAQLSTRTARLFEAACLVAQQIPGKESMLEEVASVTTTMPPELAVSTSRAVAPFLDPAAAAALRATAARLLGETAQGDGPTAFPVERFTLLREAIDGCEQEIEWSRLEGALRAAVHALAAVADAIPGERIAATDLALTCVRHLPDGDVAAALARLGPLLTPRQKQGALDEARRIVWPSDRFWAVASLSPALEIDAPPFIATDMRAVALEAREPSEDLIAALSRVAGLLTHDELRQWLDAVLARWPAAATLDLLAALARERRDSELHPDLMALGVSAVGRLGPLDLRRDALVGLIDWLLPAGAGNSFAPWRPAPEQREIAPRLLRLLAWCRPARDDMLILAWRLSAGSLSEWPRHERHPMLERPAAANALFDGDDGDASPAIPPADGRSAHAALLRAWHDDSVDRVSELVEALQAMQPRRDLDAALQLVAELSPSIPAEPLRQAAAQIIDLTESWDVAPAVLMRALGIAGAPPLFPPTKEALRAIRALAQAICLRGGINVAGFVKMWRDQPLPDSIRQELLIVALNRIDPRRRDEESAVALLMDAGLFAHPSDELLGLVLQRVVEYNSAANTRRSDTLLVLNRIAPHSGAAFLSRWLAAVAPLERHDRHGLHRTLAEVREVDAATHWRQMVDASRRFGSDRERALCLLDFAAFVPASLGTDIVAVAREIESEDARLVAFCVALSVLDRAERQPVLIEALVLARRLPRAAALGHALVQLAADIGADNAALLSEATATGVSLTDKALRASAFAELATVLPADALAAASRTFRTIGDAAARVRTMTALASNVGDPARRQAAIELVLASVVALQPASIRGAAMLVVAPMLPEARRWPVCSEGLRDVIGGMGGFERGELLDALRTGLPNAPAALMQQALTWLGTQGPDQLRSRTVAALVPYLPRWLLLPALSMVARSCDDELIAQVAPYYDEVVVAHALDRAPYLPAATKDVLWRIPRVRARASAGVRDPWPGGSDDGAAERIESIVDDWGRIDAVRSLTLDRDAAARLKSALIQAAASVGDQPQRASTVPYLSALCGTPSLPLARQAVRRVASAADRCVITVYLALRHSGDERRRLLDEALSAAAMETDPMSRAWAAAEAAAHVPELLGGALDVIWSTADDAAAARAVRTLIPRLDDASAATAAGTLSRVANEERRALELSALAPQAGPGATPAALAVVAGLHGAVLRSRALASLASQLPDDSQGDALRLLDEISADFAWLEAVAALSVRWPAIFNHGRAQFACSMLGSMGDDDFVAAWLEQMAPLWPDAAVPDLIEAARRIGSAGARAAVLSSLIYAKEVRPADAVLQAARELPDAFHRSLVLGHIASAGERVDDQLLAEAIASARATGSRQGYIDALVALSFRQVPPMVLEALLVELGGRLRIAISALRAVAPLLTSSQALTVLDRVASASGGAKSAERADLLLDIARRLDGAGRMTLLEHVSRLCSEREATGLLTDLAPLLDDEHSTQAALNFAQSMTSETFRVRTLTALLVCLGPEQQRRAIVTLVATPSEVERLRRLVEALPDVTPSVWPVILEHARQFRNADYGRALIDWVQRDPSEAGVVRDPAAGVDDARDDGVLHRLLEESLGSLAATDPATGMTAPRRETNSLRLSTLLTRVRLNRPTEVDRFAEILTSLPLLSDVGRADLLGQLPQYISEEHQATVIARLAAPLPPLVQRAAFEAACRLEDIESQKRAWSSLLPRLDKEVFPLLHGVWSDVLQTGSLEHRAAFLARLRAYVPLIHRRGGDTALVQAIQAIHDAGAVWP